DGPNELGDDDAATRDGTHAPDAAPGTNGAGRPSRHDQLSAPREGTTTNE
ncbi:MAG: hypothetical protein QOE59_2623, partial [Actinomycetota bacterium]|nr:hypothetical protein [Actinomycetota bacterium]